MIRLISDAVSAAYKTMNETTHSSLRKNKSMNWINTDELGIDTRLSLTIGYNFTNRKRNKFSANGKIYGSSIQFRKLYWMLVDNYNMGVPFIETYFNRLFRERFGRRVEKNAKALLATLKEEKDYIDSIQRITKKGAPDRRTKAYNKLENFSAWSESKTQTNFDDLSLEIKKHIQQCLASGQIPLHFSYHKDSTKKARKAAGFTPIVAFFASGQLIDNLVITYDADLTNGGD
jgi:hypothetical protein